ncbi:MAG TPA: hypothetical protein VFV67_08925 [Actinophytocola sp.]|uniref:hypothetical protein n=1 Tax=Actinophytocola sp. TaxID=1872138 RepID=UPI002DBC3C7C|nr:hypothetical protein [Actinophytocola sp.]HEU5470764.1 hypothetical protein [Actinophytocola sp.]
MAADPRQEARSTAGRLVTLARSGQLDAVTGALTLLSFAGRRQAERLRLILGALIEALATMLIWRAGAMGMSGAFGADLRGPDESAVDIDHLDPPVRATVRALLAQVNGCPQDADDQVVLALSGGAKANVQVIVLALKWTVNALEWCEADAQPEWLDRKAS